jgi:hypothetical protein
MQSGRYLSRPINSLYFLPRFFSTWLSALAAADLAALLDLGLRRTLDALFAAFLPVDFLAIARMPMCLDPADRAR